MKEPLGRNPIGYKLENICDLALLLERGTACKGARNKWRCEHVCSRNGRTYYFICGYRYKQQFNKLYPNPRCK